MISVNRTKPNKPSPDFPLYAHASGKWAKKIAGKLKYFGTWENPELALAEYDAFLRTRVQPLDRPRRDATRERAPGPKPLSDDALAKQREYGAKSRSRQPMTYLFTDGEYFKIGVTITPSERRAKAQLGNARQIVVVAMAIGNFEKDLHEMFSDLHVRGEWYKKDPRILAWFSTYGLVNLQSEDVRNVLPSETSKTDS